MRVVLSAPDRIHRGFDSVLDRIRVRTSGVKRVFNLARSYNNSKRLNDILDSPAKEQALASIKSICDGSAFPAE